MGVSVLTRKRETMKRKFYKNQSVCAVCRFFLLGAEKYNNLLLWRIKTDG
uniref:Uncharacterized protein n=1 Tax=Rhizophora mucronata TaxID=61149 RepID=A0A2P2PKP9_RHIMU